MPDASAHRWILAVLLAFSCTAWGAGPPHCPAGTHDVKVHNEYHCEKNSGPSSPASDEKSAWEALGAAKTRYNQASGAYGLSSQEAASAQRQLQAMNCGQFVCPTQEVQGRISSANASMSTQQSIMQSAINDCNAAKKAIEAARAKEGAGHWYNKDTPSCPNGSGGTTDACPKGTFRHMDKCIPGAT